MDQILKSIHTLLELPLVEQFIYIIVAFLTLALITSGALAVLFFVLVEMIMRPLLKNMKILYHFIYYMKDRHEINEWLDNNRKEEIERWTHPQQAKK
jgi:hypothetical protein